MYIYLKFWALYICVYTQSKRVVFQILNDSLHFKIFISTMGRSVCFCLGPTPNSFQGIIYSARICGVRIQPQLATCKVSALKYIISLSIPIFVLIPILPKV